ncbi:uncharacterized protein LOC123554121 [Mercenaria mercenaria]|uniref:uncharacterized protein LOC123554121 n=1 Tax=Mercenaria mercenaria TaxID=6596 RepID=UPI00234EA3B3|nr:uncharacterized protein LOC123554121 [Mercenaria mercenaria]
MSCFFFCSCQIERRLASDQMWGANRSSVQKYPKYASKTVRVTSFNDCGDIVIPPDSLADSGFFYAGFGDCVRCFQCGVGLRHWSEEDDPWIEHSRWSKDCALVRQVRGQEFVNLVQVAVEYSQNQNANEETPGDGTSGTNQEAPTSGDIENLMHTDAAQSVLEMGYHPNIIRRAIRAIREINDHEDLTAISLMEKIFASEKADISANSNEHMEPCNKVSRYSLHKPIRRRTGCNVTNKCDSNAQCEMTGGSYTCTCNTGFSGDGTTCTDIDECVGGRAVQKMKTVNTAGSFTCTCNWGFSGEGTSCIPQIKYKCNSDDSLYLYNLPEDSYIHCVFAMQVETAGGHMLFPVSDINSTTVAISGCCKTTCGNRKRSVMERAVRDPRSVFPARINNVLRVADIYSYLSGSMRISGSSTTAEKLMMIILLMTVGILNAREN